MAHLKNYAYIGLTLGLALAIGLIAWQGLEPVAAVLAVGGYSLLLLGLYQIVPILLATLSWRRLLGPVLPHNLFRLTAVTWMGLSVNWLLPVAQVGGDLLRLRLLMLGGSDGAVTGASIVADKTIQGGVQVAFSLLGVLVFIAVVGAHDLVYWAAGFSLGLSVCLYFFFRLQQANPIARMTGFLRRQMPRSQFSAHLPSGNAFDEALGAVYGRRGRLIASVLWRVVERFAKVGEVWLALWLMGHPVTLFEALILESLTQAVRAAAFIVPAGLGVQEGTLVLVGGALGLSPDLSLALSLAKRFRELVVGLPGLMGWQLYERGHRGKKPAPDGDI